MIWDSSSDRMDLTNLHSVRMRATLGTRHVSGAERIVASDVLDRTVHDLIARAKAKRLIPDKIRISIDSLSDTQPRFLKALNVATVHSIDVNAGRSLASRVLLSTGISSIAVESALHHLSQGAAPSGSNMRGAIIMNSQSGERLEPDQERGIRASRFDWTDDVLPQVVKCLAGIGLAHYRTREALALATKVAYAPGAIAELCWSDEPDYTAGYVASVATGYVRFPFLKHPGDHRGGRVIFVEPTSLTLDALIHYLQQEVVLIDSLGAFSQELPVHSR